MSISDTQSAKKYASIAETAASQAKLYALELENAPDYASEARASADAAAASSDSASQYASNASAAAVSASSSANSAADSAAAAAGAAGGAINQTVRAPAGESLTALPAAGSRIDKFIVTGPAGDVDTLDRSSVPLLGTDGKLPVSVIPSIALTEPFVVNSQAAMLALTAQVGDIAKRTDLGYSFCLAASPASTLSNWVQLTDDVLAQLGQSTGAAQVGAVNLAGGNSTVQIELNSKAKAGANSDITSLAGLTTPLSTAQGGLGNTNGTVPASSVPYTQAGAGAVPRTQAQKNAEILSVKEYDAKGDGSTDDTTAFSNAAKAATAKNIAPSVYSTMPHGIFCEVFVPAGNYVLNSLVDVGGRAVNWILDPGASFNTINNLNGRVVIDSVRNNNNMHYGTLDSACSFSVSGNRGSDAPAQILGVTAPNQLAVYTDRDTVGFYAENYAPAALATISSANYTATTATFSSALSASQLARLRVGMIIDTMHTTKYTGVITSWASNGLSVTVEGWYLADGASSTHTATIPPGSAGLYINPLSKAWAMNANVFWDSSSYASAAVGFELGVSNDKFDYDPATDSWHTWCYDAITLGSKRCETAYMQRGYFYKGYESRGATGYNFVAKNAGTSWASGAVYYSQANSDYQILIQPDLYSNKASFSVKKEGHIEMGRTDAAQTTILDFHSSGNDIDYDARISVQGGSATLGQANVTFSGGQFFWSTGYAMDASLFRPTTDSGRNLGSASYRFNTVYASTGTINTSDVTTKTFLDINEAEKLAAGEIKGMMRKFQFNDAISEKGADKARYHFGVGAQYVRDVLIKHGLEPDMYAFLCYDKWDDEYEDVYEEVEVEKEICGKKDEPVMIDGEQAGIRTVDVTYTVKSMEMRKTGERKMIREAGERYGIRYDELICFVISSI